MQLLFRLIRCTEVRVIQDATKKEIMEQFQLLEREAVAYEEYHQKGEVLSVIIRWIGWSAKLSRKELSKYDAEKL